MQTILQVSPAPPLTFVEAPTIDRLLLYPFWNSLFKVHARIFNEANTLRTAILPVPGDLSRFLVYDSRYRFTGLSIVAQGSNDGIEVQWSIYYNQAGQIIAGPYDLLDEAHFIAGVLSKFDWTRPAIDFTRQEVSQITRIITMYREDITCFRHLLVETLEECCRHCQCKP
jgi:hypothetical protein